MSTDNLPQRTARTETKYWELNSRYVRYCMIALVVSMIGHAVYLAYGPAPEAQPYVLVSPTIEVIDIPPEIRVPPPPKPIERPKLRVDLDITDEPVDQDIDTEPTNIDLNDWKPQPLPDPDTIFVPYDTAPDPIKIVKPRYPDLARQAYAEGLVAVQVTIDPTGRVIDAVVIHSNTIDSLEEAALKAARRCLFKPALQRDTPVKSLYILPFKFKLQK